MIDSVTHHGGCFVRFQLIQIKVLNEVWRKTSKVRGEAKRVGDVGLPLRAVDVVVAYARVHERAERRIFKDRRD